MFQKLPFFPRSFPRFIAFTGVLLVILASAACSSSSDTEEPPEETSDGLALVWEAWEEINRNYASSEALEPESVLTGAMARVLEQLDITPYPFLTDVGRMRGQAPAHVPGEMLDLWRAVALYQEIGRAHV